MIKTIFVWIIIFVFLGCTQTQPQLENLNALVPLTFDGATKKTVEISDLSEKISIVAACGRFTENVEISFQNNNPWSTVSSSSVVQQAKNDCKTKSQFTLVLQADANGLGFTKGVSATKSIYLRARTLESASESSELRLSYTPMNSTLARVSSAAGEVQNVNGTFALKYRIGFGASANSKGSTFESRARTRE